MTIRLVGPAATNPDDAVRLGDLTERHTLYQTQGLHVAGVGHLPLGWAIPYDGVIEQVRYWAGTAGTGGTAAVELRLNGTAGGNTIASSSAAPDVSSPSWATPNAAVSATAGDRLYVFQTAVNSTTLGIGLMAEIVIRRT